MPENRTGWGRGRRSSRRIGRKYKTERSSRRGQNDDGDDAAANDEVDEASDVEVEDAETSEDDITMKAPKDVVNEIVDLQETVRSGGYE